MCTLSPSCNIPDGIGEQQELAFTQRPSHGAGNPLSVPLSATAEDANDFEQSAYETAGNQNNQLHDHSICLSGSGNSATLSPSLIANDYRVFNIGNIDPNFTRQDRGCSGAAFQHQHGFPMASSREHFLAWRQQQQQRQPSYPLHQQQLAVGQLTAELNDRSYITWSKPNENGPMDTLRKTPYKCCPHRRRPYSPTDTHFEGSSSISQCHCHRCLNNLDPNLHFPSFDGRLAQPSMQQPQPIHLVLQDRHRPPAGNTDTLSSNNIVDPFLEFLEATNLEDRNANDVQNSPLVPSAFLHATTPSFLSDPVREATSALPVPLAPPAQPLTQSPRCLNTPGTLVLLSETIAPLRPIPQVPTGSPLDISSPTSQNEPTYIPALTLLSSVPLNQSVNMTPVAVPIEGELNTVAIEESENVSMAAITRKKIKSLWKQFRCERLADKVMS